MAARDSTKDIKEVGVQFGYDSNEYDMVGLKRTSERKRQGPTPAKDA